MAREKSAPKEVDYEAYLDKPASVLQKRFADWILDKTDFDPSSFKNKEQLFRETVRLSVQLRLHFQASPENHAAIEAEREARSLLQQQGEEPAPKARKTAKAAAVNTVSPDDADDDAEEEVNTPAPPPAPPVARRGRAKKAAPAATPAAKPAATPGRRPVRRSTNSTTTAAF